MTIPLFLMPQLLRRSPLATTTPVSRRRATRFTTEDDDYRSDYDYESDNDCISENYDDNARMSPSTDDKLRRRLRLRRRRLLARSSCRARMTAHVPVPARLFVSCCISIPRIAGECEIPPCPDPYWPYYWLHPFYYSPGCVIVTSPVTATSENHHEYLTTAYSRSHKNQATPSPVRTSVDRSRSPAQQESQ